MKSLIKNITGIIHSLAINGRDIVATLLGLVAVLFVANLVTQVGLKYGIDISETKDYVFAIGKFAGAALCGIGYLTHVTFRHSLGDHDKNEFLEAWHDLTKKERLEWFFRFSIAGLIAASLVFSIGV